MNTVRFCVFNISPSFQKTNFDGFSCLKCFIWQIWQYVFVKLSDIENQDILQKTYLECFWAVTHPSKSRNEGYSFTCKPLSEWISNQRDTMRRIFFLFDSSFLINWFRRAKITTRELSIIFPKCSVLWKDPVNRRIQRNFDPWFRYIDSFSPNGSLSFWSLSRKDEDIVLHTFGKRDKLSSSS